eukprot:3020170-Amphidinium_carterae.1
MHVGTKFERTEHTPCTALMQRARGGNLGQQAPCFDDLMVLRADMQELLDAVDAILTFFGSVRCHANPSNSSWTKLRLPLETGSTNCAKTC